MKVIFFGTPEFAAVSLEALIKEHEVIAVVSQPDKPKGRGKKLIPTPVKETAVKYNIPVLQPESAKDEAFIDTLGEYKADIFVVAAYGQILTERLLNLPRHGSINVHGSLLPKYRGAAPIQQAILDGESVTGITIMYMAKRLDAGDMILKKEVVIEEDDTFGRLHDKMALAGAKALMEALKLIEDGREVREKQDDALSTYASKITKEMGKIDFSKSSKDVVNQIRGFDPVPGAYAFYEGDKIKLFRAVVSAEKGNRPGEVLSADKRGIIVSTGDGAVCIKEIQAAGSKRMAVSAYLLGHKIEKNKTFE